MNHGRRERHCRRGSCCVCFAVEEGQRPRNNRDTEPGDKQADEGSDQRADGHHLVRRLLLVAFTPGITARLALGQKARE